MSAYAAVYDQEIIIVGENSDIKFFGRALRYRNYRLFFSGQLISLSGSWMQMLAVGWLMYRLTRYRYFFFLP